MGSFYTSIGFPFLCLERINVYGSKEQTFRSFISVTSTTPLQFGPQPMTEHGSSGSFKRPAVVAGIVAPIQLV